MKKLLFTTMFLLLCAVFAVAQTAGNQSSNNPSQSGTSSTSGQTGSQTGTTTPSTPDQAAPPSSTSPSSQSGSQDMSKSQSASTKGEKKIEGCLESAGSSGQYTLKHKNKEVAVIPDSSVASEFSSHVGHKVKLSGTWEQASASTSAMNNPSGGAMPQSDQPGASGSSTSKSTDASKNAKTFKADKVEMVADQCEGGSNKSKDNSSTTPKPY